MEFRINENSRFFAQHFCVGPKQNHDFGNLFVIDFDFLDVFGIDVFKYNDLRLTLCALPWYS